MLILSSESTVLKKYIKDSAVVLGFSTTSAEAQINFLKVVFFSSSICPLIQISESCGHSSVLLATMGSFVVHFTTIHNRGSAFSVYIL